VSACDRKVTERVKTGRTMAPKASRPNEPLRTWPTSAGPQIWGWLRLLVPTTQSDPAGGERTRSERESAVVAEEAQPCELRLTGCHGADDNDADESMGGWAGPVSQE